MLSFLTERTGGFIFGGSTFAVFGAAGCDAAGCDAAGFGVTGGVFCGGTAGCAFGGSDFTGCDVAGWDKPKLPLSVSLFLPLLLTLVLSLPLPLLSPPVFASAAGFETAVAFPVVAFAVTLSVAALTFDALPPVFVFDGGNGSFIPGFAAITAHHGHFFRLPE